MRYKAISKYLIAACLVIVPLYIMTANDQGAVSQTQTNQQASPQPVKIPPPIKRSNIDTEKPQTLPFEMLEVINASGHKLIFQVEVAKTLEQQKTGLMFRKDIPENTGMLFVFPDIRERTFWMKNTWASLDLLFIRKDGVIHHISPNAPPMSENRIHSNGPVLAVFEIAAGEAERLGLQVGDRLLHNAFTTHKDAPKDADK